MPNIRIKCHSKDQLLEMNRFIIDRIPDRNCWSIARTPEYRDLEELARLIQGQMTIKPKIYDYWFSKRYAWVGFELLLHYG